MIVTNLDSRFHIYIYTDNQTDIFLYDAHSEYSLEPYHCHIL